MLLFQLFQEYEKSLNKNKTSPPSKENKKESIISLVLWAAGISGISIGLLGGGLYSFSLTLFYRLGGTQPQTDIEYRIILHVVIFLCGVMLLFLSRYTDINYKKKSHRL